MQTSTRIQTRVGKHQRRAFSTVQHFHNIFAWGFLSRTLNSSQTYFTALQVFSCLYIAVIWYNRSLVSTNLVTLRRARLVLEWVTARAIESVALAQCWYLISQPGQLNLAIPLWVGKMSMNEW